eukprot:403356425
MRVLILASSAQKAKIADKLIKSKALSKVMISVGSKKLVTNAQALIIYYESLDDLKKMKKLLKIYMGVPMKFYFGNELPTAEEKNFFTYHQAKDMVLAMQEENKKVQESADEIFKALKKDDKELTVEDLLQGLDENERDVIEEICVEYFAEKKSDKDPKSVIIREKKFKQWWSEGKLDKFEQIKFYIIDWVIKQLQQQGIDQVHSDRFQSYIDKKKQIRILNEHFESNFELIIQPQVAKEESKKEEVKQGQPQLASQLLKGGGKFMGIPGKPVPQASPRGERKIHLDGDGAHKTKGGETKQQDKTAKIGTSIDFKITFFPNENDDKVMYLQNLHMFEEQNWFSIGIKPRAKDLKSVLEDLEQMDYLKNLSDYSPSIVLDGKKVRIGAQSYLLDPFYETHADAGEKLKKMSQVFDEKSVEAILEFNVTLQQKLETILQSEDPILTEISKGLKFEGSLKFHKKQFKQILETTTEKKYKDFDKKAETEEDKKEEDGDKSESQQDDDDKESQSQKDSNSNKFEEDEDDDGYGDEDNDDDEDDDDDDSDSDSDSEDDEEDEEGKKAFSIEYFFKYLLPFFMFKWNSKIELNPDINDIKAYCNKNFEESFLLGNFKKIVQHLKETDLDEAAKQALLQKKKGTRKELLNYLAAEVGSEVEFAWMTSCFFINGQIKTDEMGKVLRTLSNAKFI